jgi:hypothetical protein
MGSGGFILGGLLAGVGKGMSDDILAQRQTALENLRAGHDASNISLKAGYDDERQDKHDQNDYKKSVALKTLDGTQAVNVEGVRGQNKIAEVKTQGQIDAGLQARHDENERQKAIILANLDQQNTIEAMRVKRQIEGTEVMTTYTNSKGNLVIVGKGGRVITTNIRGEAPKGDQGGGSLDGLRTGGAAPNPAPAAAPAPALPTPATSANGAPAASASKPATKGKISQADRTTLYTQALNKANTGDPRFSGLSASQIKAKVDDSLLNQGYTF